MSASANARSHVSSNPALSTTMLTSRVSFPPGCARNADTAFVSSARRYASPDESASDNAFAARSPPDAPPPSFPPSSGQMLRSMRLPHSDTIRNSRSVSAMEPLSLFEADAILAANAFAFLASDAAAPMPASRPARLSVANGSWPWSGDAGSKYPIAARILR